MTLSPPRSKAEAPGRPPARRRPGRATALAAHGEPYVWLTGGTLVLALLMIAGLLALVLRFGMATFWPQPLVRLQTAAGETYLGEVVEEEWYAPGPRALARLPEQVAARAGAELAEHDGLARRLLVRTGNFELTQTHFHWVDDFAVEERSEPPWAVVVERLKWGRFYGFPAEFRIEGDAVATAPEEVWALYERHHGPSRARWEEKRELETDVVGRINRRIEDARLELAVAERDLREGSEALAAARGRYEEARAALDREFAEVRERIAVIERENARFELVLETAGGERQPHVLSHVVRAYAPDRLGPVEKVGLYLSRWWEFLTSDPREANSEGGVFPAIFGTVAMTIVMSVVVVPFGVLAALYLREYARQGLVISVVRVAVNNLAGVPSIVFGVFGLGFFAYIVGGWIDFAWPRYSAKLPDPTFGTDGLLWASFTLALLTLPVVIVATEEALAAVPSSMRDGSYACGATKWQTIRRIVLPRAAPGIMTGMILAIARGAGEVAPLMLVGAVKLAPELPIDLGDWTGGVGPIPTGPLHLERSFMHLGFHVYDVGFQSQNSEAAKPMVYTTTLLLILIIVLLNLLAIGIRARLRRRFHGTQV